VRIALAICFLTTVFSSLTTGESAAPTFHSSVSEVHLNFFATDENGNAVHDLTPHDFALVDEGFVIRDFHSFSATHELNVNVVILVDCSESVLHSFRNEMTGMLELLSRTRWSPGDELSVISFRNTEATLVCGSDCLDRPFDDWLSSLHPGGATPLYDALVSTGHWLREKHHSQSNLIVILISDGMDNISRYSALDAVQSVLASDARIYSLDLNNPDAALRDMAAMRNLAEATGGRYFHLSDGAVRIVRSIIDDQRASYTLTYQPLTRKPGLHSVGIFPAHNLHLQFHSRRFYTFGDTTP